MSDPPKFSFGQPASSSGAAPSLFGTVGSTAANNQANANTAGKLAFGSSPSAPGTATGSLFGGNSASGSNLFGSGTQTPTTGGGASLFANATTNSTSNPPISASAAATSSSAAPAFSFTNSASTQAGSALSTTSASTGNLFGAVGNTLSASSGNAGLAGGSSGSQWSFGLTSTSSQAPATSTATASSLGGGNMFSAPSASSADGPTGASTPQGQRQPATLFSTTPAGNPPSSSLFGKTNAQSTTQAAVPALTTASAPSQGLFGSLANNRPDAPKTGVSNLFAQPATNASTQSGPKPMFGTTPSSSSAASTSALNTTSGTASATPAAGLFSNIPTTSAATAASQPASSNASIGGSLLSGIGGTTMSQNATNTPAPTQSSGLGATTIVNKGGAGLFGTATSGANAGTTGTHLFAGASAASGSTNTTAAGAPNQTTAASNSNTSAAGLGSTNGAAPPSHSRLAQKTMDEILTSWSTSLTSHQKTFQSLAKQVSAWDRMLVENSTRISQLYGRCFQAERDCSEVERQVTSVEHSQNELDALLERYESDVNRLLDQAGMGVGGNASGGIDAERERTYKLAEDCSYRLNDMGQSLTSMIDEINEASTRLSPITSNTQTGGRNNDPLVQIVRVLNQHLAQLQDIDSGATALQSRVGAAQREARSIGQANGINGASRTLDDFGRSYLGRF